MNAAPGPTASSRRATSADLDAFAQTYDATVGDAYRLARCLVGGDSGRAESLVHDAMIAVFHDRDRWVDSGLSATAWVLAHVRSTARDLA